MLEGLIGLEIEMKKIHLSICTTLAEMRDLSQSRPNSEKRSTVLQFTESSTDPSLNTDSLNSLEFN